MKYNMTEPCDECPFTMGSGFTFERLSEHASGEFPCHKACDVNDDGEFEARSEKTPHCAGALIFLEKQNKPHQMMRICERIGLYDRTMLNMDTNVGSKPQDYQEIRTLSKKEWQSIHGDFKGKNPDGSLGMLTEHGVVTVRVI